MNFDFDYDRVRGSFLIRIVVLLFPAIMLWLFSLIGFTIPLKTSEDWILFVVYWAVAEFLAMLYFLGDMENKKDIIKRLFLNWGVAKIFLELIFLGPGASMLEEGLSKGDSYRIQYAGIALFSMFLPFIVAILYIIFMVAMFSSLST
jgi:hypothetical protein